MRELQESAKGLLSNLIKQAKTLKAEEDSQPTGIGKKITKAVKKVAGKA